MLGLAYWFIPCVAGFVWLGMFLAPMVISGGALANTV
jgi:hypothetical protein